MSPAPFPATTGDEPCAAGDPERFHPEKGTNGKALDRVKADCRSCHVMDGCLAYALTHRVSGIWAGTSTEERVEIRMARGITAKSVSLGDVLPGPKSKPFLGAHGGWGAVSRHRTVSEPLCDECREFTNVKRREHKAAAKARALAEAAS